MGSMRNTDSDGRARNQAPPEPPWGQQKRSPRKIADGKNDVLRKMGFAMGASVALPTSVKRGVVLQRIVGLWWFDSSNSFLPGWYLGRSDLDKRLAGMLCFEEARAAGAFIA